MTKVHGHTMTKSYYHIRSYLYIIIKYTIYTNIFCRLSRYRCSFTQLLMIYCNPLPGPNRSVEASDATTWHVATADVGSLTGQMGFLPVDQAYCWSFKEGRIPTKTTENATTPMVNYPKTQSPRNSCGWRLRLYGCYTVFMSFDIVPFPFSRDLLNYLRKVFWQC